MAQDDAGKCSNGRCVFAKDPSGSLVPKNSHGKRLPYALCGPQVEPDAGLWLREVAAPGGGAPIRLPRQDEVVQLTLKKDDWFGNLPNVFPKDETALAQQLDQLKTLQAARDTLLTRVTPPDGLTLAPTSRFLDLQCVPFGAAFNTTRPQYRVSNIADWRRRINLKRQVVLTGRELARLFEEETPGLYHRHVLNWLLVLRPDIAPPRHARVWMALDMAIYTALTAAWYFKWLHPDYRFLLRPSEYAVLKQPRDPQFNVLYDKFIDSDGEGDAAVRGCPDFSPGTPRHPAWPSGHSTYSAAASYVLEYFFSPETIINRTPDQAVASDAAKVAPKNWARSGVWIANELRCLASNIGEARLWGGVHWADDHRAGQRIGRAAGQAVLERILQDCVPVRNTGACPPRRDECPPHPDIIQPVSCNPLQETVLQEVPDEALRTLYGTI